MEKQKDELRDVFYNQLHNLEVQPPDAVWEKVLLATQPKKRTFYLWRVAAAIALLLAVTVPVTMIFFQKPDVQAVVNVPDRNTDQPKAIESEIASSQVAETQINLLGSPEIAKTTKQSVAPIRSLPTLESPSNDQMASLTDQTEDKSSTFIEDIISPEETILAQNESVQTTALDETRRAEILLAEKLLKQVPDFVLDDQLKKELIQKSKMNVALAYGSVPGGSVTANELLYGNNSVKYRNDAFQNDMAYETSFYEEIERTDIHPPLTLGLKFSYRLGKRISIETGITYTSLSVLTRTIMIEDNYSEYLRSIHYIGLPLGMRWDALQFKHFKAYLQQSAMVEKGVAAVNKSMRFETGSLHESNRNTSRIPGFQLSTLSSVGGDVNIYQRFSIYGEAGVQVFYLNSTQPFNMRSAKMMWPVFQTGIRLNF